MVSMILNSVCCFGYQIGICGEVSLVLKSSQTRSFRCSTYLKFLVSR